MPDPSGLLPDAHFPLPTVLAITGASGAIYAKRTLEALLAAGRDVHLVGQPFRLSSDRSGIEDFTGARAVELGRRTRAFRAGRLCAWKHDDLSAGIASGSFPTAGMAIVPCSMGTLAAIAHGQGTNLIHRAADVHLKERRKLVLVPRETPLSSIAIDNMARVTNAGAVVLPAMPGFYHNPKSIDDLVDFVVVRICGQLDVPFGRVKPWGEDAKGRGSEEARRD